MVLGRRATSSTTTDRIEIPCVPKDLREVVIANTSKDQQASAEQDDATQARRQARLAANPLVWVMTGTGQSGPAHWQPAGPIAAPPKCPF